MHAPFSESDIRDISILRQGTLRMEVKIAGQAGQPDKPEKLKTLFNLEQLLFIKKIFPRYVNPAHYKAIGIFPFFT